ncbi:Paraneoplastic antigen-like protein 8B [Galemys pyrenaicus]|uniref:Paraneoplastic antigen-like protein 8B n=1 Tax=Galemys pyrenaicus TaxID=202257 RepID=A0A8J6A7K3_GALPY|nr:Paraneoplastic antigen-like protein 8B [Galemys pyrenaicus]
MALSLLRDWCRGLEVDAHRALLAAGIPEGLEPAAIAAVLQPALRPLGTFMLRNTSAVSPGKAQAAPVEFVEDIEHAAIPREMPAEDGVGGFCAGSARRTRRQMERLLLGERPQRAGRCGRDPHGHSHPAPLGDPLAGPGVGAGGQEGPSGWQKQGQRQQVGPEG